MTRLLLLDVGKTGCRAALVEAGVRVASGQAPGAGGIAEADGPARALGAIAAATEGWPAPDRIAAGLAGLASAPGRAGALAAGLRARFGAAVEVLLGSDMTLWHAGALGGAPGVVLAAGTGTVALGVDAGGRSARVDGWGHQLGDDGSGYAIGRAGLRAALRAQDGRPGGSNDLLARVRARFGDPDGVPARMYGAANPAREIAAFAPDVLAVAAVEPDADPVAAGIVGRAATDLADAAAAAAHRLQLPARPTGVQPVACGGGLLAAGPVLTGPLDAALTARSLTRTTPLGDALDGARLLLEDPHVPHHALLTAAETPAPGGAR
ncbi:N-acetylglucosamine kinase [Pseudonocardia nantongensis]|uniref:N-acetylglucosamine kinase n=1 Tax=Pseudonocardia nantongensis TaxID=1181885 RepID=UPI003979D902